MSTNRRWAVLEDMGEVAHLMYLPPDGELWTPRCLEGLEYHEDELEDPSSRARCPECVASLLGVPATVVTTNLQGLSSQEEADHG